MFVRQLKKQRSARSQQNGAALLLALLTVTLVVTMAAASMWRQWRDVEVETAERARIQSAWVLTGALDWARLILREDGRGSAGVDHLAEPWAVGLQEARLSSFLATEASSTPEIPDTRDAFLSGHIVDLQSRMNLLNLIKRDSAGTAQIADAWMHSFSKLFELLGLPLQELDLLAENLRVAVGGKDEAAKGTVVPLIPLRLEHTAWLGLSARSIAALQPYVSVLQTGLVVTPVNINTASAQVIFASVQELDLAAAQRLVAQRERAHFETLDAAGRQLGEPFAADIKSGRHSVGSQYFEVLGRLRLDQVVTTERSVVYRENREVSTLLRERGSLQSPGSHVVPVRPPSS